MPNRYRQSKEIEFIELYDILKISNCLKFISQRFLPPVEIVILEFGFLKIQTKFWNVREYHSGYILRNQEGMSPFRRDLRLALFFEKSLRNDLFY